MIKNVIRVAVVLSIAVVVCMLYSSVKTPIEFEELKDARKAAVIERLINIRKAEVEYKDQNGVYTASFDTLIDFVKNNNVAVIMKEGRITDQQLTKGLTEKKALQMIAEDNGADAEKYGIEDWETFKSTFKRDTVYENILKARFDENYPIDSIRYVPFTNGQEFELVTDSFTNASNMVLPLFEARVTNDVYLNGLNKQLIKNMNEDANTIGKYPGLKVGDITAPNNNAGNWE